MENVKRKNAEVLSKTRRVTPTLIAMLGSTVENRPIGHIRPCAQSLRLNMNSVTMTINARMTNSAGTLTWKIENQSLKLVCKCIAPRTVLSLDGSQNQTPIQQRQTLDRMDSIARVDLHTKALSSEQDAQASKK